MSDYLYNQNQRRTSQSPWTPYQQPNQPPPNPDYPELFASRTLLPDRRFSRWRRDRKVAPSRPQDTVPQGEEQFASRSLLPVAARGPRRAAARAYELAATQVELYGGAPQEVGELVPDRRGQRWLARAASDAYRLTPTQVELYGGAPQEGGKLLPTRADGPRRAANELYQLRRFFDPTAVAAVDNPELFAARSLFPSAAPGARRAGAHAYDLAPTEVELYGGAPQEVGDLLPSHVDGPRRSVADAYRLRPFFDPTAPAGDQLELFGGRQLLPDRARSRWRRGNRRVASGTPGATPPASDSPELFGARTLLPQSYRPVWRRAQRRDRRIAASSAGVPSGPVQNEELFPTRQLLPDKYISRWRRLRRRTSTSSRDVAPPTPLEETYPGRSQFSQPPIWSRRVSILITNDDGLFTATQLHDDQELLSGRQQFSQPPTWSRKYHVLLVNASGVDFESNVELIIAKTLFPERAPGKRRAPWDAYQLAPSLVELYATKTPIEIGQRLIPDRAPGRRRAAQRAYQLENNLVSLYAPAFVPPSRTPTRTLLGAGL